MEKTGQNITFSYDLVLPQKPPSNQEVVSWYVMEKGSEKSEETRKYEMSFFTIISASIELQNYINVSPCYQSSLLRDQGFDIYLKRELYQPLESIKGRGVIYTLLKLSEKQKRKGVITISTGSFACILCYYGNEFGIPVTVVMPTSTKNYDYVQKYTGSLATIIFYGNNILEAHSFALHCAQQNGLFYLDGQDHPNMIIGQATLEISEIMNIDAVILPTLIDDCGLIASIVMALTEINQRILIIEAQPTNYDPLIRQIRSRTMSENELTIPVIKYEWPQYSEKLFSWYVKVDNKAISDAAKILRTEYIFDNCAAIGLAPIVSGHLDMLKGKRVVIFLFGAMDSAADIAIDSNLCEPCVGLSTSHETSLFPEC